METFRKFQLFSTWNGSLHHILFGTIRKFSLYSDEHIKKFLLFLVTDIRLNNRDHSPLFSLGDAVVPSVVTCAFESPKTLVSNINLMTAMNYKIWKKFCEWSPFETINSQQSRRSWKYQLTKHVYIIMSFPTAVSFLTKNIEQSFLTVLILQSQHFCIIVSYTLSTTV